MKAHFIVCIIGAFGIMVRTAAFDEYVDEVKPTLAKHCAVCHGPTQQKGGLRLDTAAFALRGGSSGPALVPGDSAGSLIIQVVTGSHPTLPRMPYKRDPLNSAQIAALQKWIDAGAEAPTDERPAAPEHWAFIPPVRALPPAVKDSDWPRNPIDQFILARLEAKGIEPSPEADRVTLIRRVTLDLTGLPPTIEEVDAFLQDARPDAYERLVDRLLRSPHYGEQWARHWLDVARYADSNGYSIDAPRAIWKYRDWVINALNRDMPYDQFVIEQLAGDLLPDATVEQKIATGFNRNTQVNQEGGIDPEQFRVESVIDRVNTTATAFLGLTVACAQCHDHKFDPISQKDYYQLYAFFNNTVDDGHGKAAPGGMLEVPGEVESPEGLEAEMEEAAAELDRYLNTKGSELAAWETGLSEEEKSKLKPDIRKILEIPFASRTVEQKRAVYSLFRPEDQAFRQRAGKLARLERRQPKPVTTLVMMELAEPRESFVFIKGDFTRPGEPVKPGFPAVFNQAIGAADTRKELNRLDLARWIVDPQNPLAARVIVNRIWQRYFGKGIVETENDFGTQGSPPSHPELLDWLAMELMSPSEQTGPDTPVPWSLKRIHRLIVTSATYRQSSRFRPELAAVDPNNSLLARQSRLRLNAETVRDVCLSASGLLEKRVGGPSVFPPQSEGVMALGQVKREWRTSTGANRYRRGMYTFFWRATPHPALMVFDAPDAFSACTRRPRSNTPLQALTLLNDEAFYEAGRALAHRLLSMEQRSDAERIRHGFRLCVARAPSRAEEQRLLDLVAQQREYGTGSEAEQEAWTSVARVLLNLDETITRE